jgi:antitoxin MazE
MKTQIIQIGNSQGIRIPKVLLEESGISGEVDLELLPDGILIRNIGKPRANWNEIFRSISDMDEEELPAAQVRTEFEIKEWQW